MFDLISEVSITHMRKAILQYRPLLLATMNLQGACTEYLTLRLVFYNPSICEVS